MRKPMAMADHGVRKSLTEPHGEGGVSRILHGAAGYG